MSVQDQGRPGFRHLGVCRSGAMDPLSLSAANEMAGGLPTSAGLELGPGPCEIEVLQETTLAFTGAVREGVSWWGPTRFRKGDRISLSSALQGQWSYVALRGGLQAESIMGSRSASVREGIGKWLTGGDELSSAHEYAEPSTSKILPLTGPIRVFGQVPSAWTVSNRIDRMGYLLEGQTLPGGSPDEWSEPIPLGTIQLTPAGQLFVMMSEGSTAGGYPVMGYVHPEDLRLLAQTRSGGQVRFVPA